MKQRLINLAERIDALSVRERALVFAALLVAIAFAGFHLVLDPAWRVQDALKERASQARASAAGIDTEIAARMQAYKVDPDAAVRSRLTIVEQDSGALTASLLEMQGGMVAPERMAPLLNAILRSNGRLQLVSMRTLPVQTVPGSAGADTPDEPATVPAAGARATDGGRPSEALYRHGVELTVRGNYLDMVAYMEALETMPTRLFWGKAQLDVEDFPGSRLTLTLYTLSLDRNWMKL